MTAFFFERSKLWKRLWCVLGVCITFLSLCYANLLYNAQTVGTGREFYFLLSESLTTQATAEFVQLQGGAGYTLIYNNREYVAYSVYLTEEESKLARLSVSDNGENAMCLSLRCNQLYLKNPFDKRSGTQIKGAFESLYGCIKILNGEIKRLEKGATQESSQRVLRILARQLDYLSKENPLQTSEYAQVCEKASMRIVEITNDIVYVKDLRYLLCDICTDYLKLSKNFSL